MPRRKWTPAIILQALRARAAAGASLTFSAAKREAPTLLSAAVRHFGNWANAIQAAGFAYGELKAEGRRQRAEKVRKWSRERIIAEIRRLHAAGEDLCWSNVESKYQRLCSAAVKPAYFGSWAAAITAAGLDYEELRRRARPGWQRRWRSQLKAGEAQPRPPTPASPPTARPGWARELLREKEQESGAG